MLKKRVIARLDIKGPNLVKGIHLEGLRVMGDPAEFAKMYYLEGVDELFYMDVVASLYERNGLTDLVSKTAKEVFIPLTVGGGIRSLADIKQALRAGADKVCINTGAVKSPELIRQASQSYGSSTIVAAIECVKQSNGKYFAVVDNGREETGLEVLEWAQKLVHLGVGEIVITSVDREGTGEGLDLDLINLISSKVPVPVVAHGGVGKISDVVAGYQAGADAVAIASVLHYQALANGKVSRDQKREEGNTRFLSENRSFAKITPISLTEIKAGISAAGFPVRTLV